MEAVGLGNPAPTSVPCGAFLLRSDHIFSDFTIIHYKPAKFPSVTYGSLKRPHILIIHHSCQFSDGRNPLKNQRYECLMAFPAPYQGDCNISTKRLCLGRKPRPVPLEYSSDEEYIHIQICTSIFRFSSARCFGTRCALFISRDS